MFNETEILILFKQTANNVLLMEGGGGGGGGELAGTAMKLDGCVQIQHLSSKYWYVRSEYSKQKTSLKSDNTCLASRNWSRGRCCM